ncbi:MAG: type I secretion system permease/ATPase [Alphaproteobacteria bacterium]|nr:type I secretion system permease/ATPase [Alphaproteobacteria bacterium]
MKNSHPFETHWFFKAVRDNTHLYNRVVVASIFINIFALASPLFVMNVYDRVIPNHALVTGWVLSIGIATVFLFDFIMKSLRSYFVDLAGQRIDRVVGARIYDHLLNIQLAGKPASSGSFAAQLREFDYVRDFITSATLTTIVDMPFAILFIVIIALIAGPVVMIIFGLMILMLLVSIIIMRVLKHYSLTAHKIAETRHGLLVETISSIEVLKTLQADKTLKKRYDHYTSKAAATGQHSRFYSGLAVNFSVLMQQLSTVVIILAGMYMIKDNAMSMGALIASVMLAGRALAPFSQVANLLTRYQQVQMSLATLDKFMALEGDKAAGRTYVRRKLEGAIQFDRATFSYPHAKKPALERINFTVNAGERIGVIGRIGSGKSTVAKLIAGLYSPQEGLVKIDGTDISQIDPVDRRSQIAYLPQEPKLLNGSVKDNILAGLPEATDEQIIQAINISGLAGFIGAHPLGIDAPVGEGGAYLSGGQRQTVALARALVKNPKILILDEPTNSMDTQVEEFFIRQMAEIVKGRTLIVITHRTSPLALVDRIMLIDQGRLVRDGNKEAVLQELAQGKVEVPQ